MQPPLAPALEALRAGRLSDALGHLLEVWEDARDPQVAHAIERLTDAIVPHRPPLQASQRQWQRVWLEREAANHPADTGVLARALMQGGPGTARFKERVQRLLDRKPHPGLLAHWLENIEHIPMFSPLGPQYSKLMARHGDPRQLEAIDGALQLGPTGPGGPYTKTERDKRLKRLRSAVKKLATGPVEGSDALGAAVTAGLATDPSSWALLEEAAEDAVLGDLWQAVSDAPDDDRPRLVFADRVAETDPDHAVFIQRQIAYETRPRTNAERKEDNRWLKARQADWLGPLGPYVNRKGARFRRGFLDAGLVISASEQEASELAGLPYWHTAAALWCKHVSFFGGLPDGVLESVGCRVVRGRAQLGERWTTNGGGKALQVAQLRRLMKAGPFRWPVLQVQTPESTTDLACSLLRELEGSPLTTLVLPTMGVSPRILDALPSQLEEVVVGPWSFEAVDVLDRLPRLRRFTYLGQCDVTLKEGFIVVRTFEPTISEDRYAGAADPQRVRTIRAALNSARPGWTIREITAGT